MDTDRLAEFMGIGTATFATVVGQAVTIPLEIWRTPSGRDCPVVRFPVKLWNDRYVIDETVVIDGHHPLTGAPAETKFALVNSHTTAVPGQMPHEERLAELDDLDDVANGIYAGGFPSGQPMVDLPRRDTTTDLLRGLVAAWLLVASISLFIGWLFFGRG